MDHLSAWRNCMSHSTVWRSMWKATGRLAEKVGLAIPGAAARKEKEKPATRCPDCLQKLRYRRERAGLDVQCPRCRHRFSLPMKPRPVFPLSKAKVGYSAFRERL